MKIAVLAATAASAAAFAPAAQNVARQSTSLNAKVGLYYQTQTGNTETVANFIATAAKIEAEDLAEASADDIKACDALIVGAPTWNTDAEEERSGTDWDSWLYDVLPDLGLEGKKVAVFGCGDSASYGDYYCDAAGELYDQFEAAGCKMMGFTSTDGYDHMASKAERDGKFIGLMTDEDNQNDMSEDRAKAWVEQLKGEGFF